MRGFSIKSQERLRFTDKRPVYQMKRSRGFTKINQFIVASDMKVPLMSEIKDFALAQKISQKELHDIINYLVEIKKSSRSKVHLFMQKLLRKQRMF